MSTTFWEHLAFSLYFNPVGMYLGFWPCFYFYVHVHILVTFFLLRPLSCCIGNHYFVNECVDRLEVFSQNPQWDVISIEGIFLFGFHMTPHYSRVWNKRTPLNKRSPLENLAKRIIVAPFLPYTMKSGIRP